MTGPAGDRIGLRELARGQLVVVRVKADPGQPGEQLRLQRRVVERPAPLQQRLDRRARGRIVGDLLDPDDGQIEPDLLHTRPEERVLRLGEVAQGEPRGGALGRRIEIGDDTEQGQDRRGIRLAQPRGQGVEGDASALEADPLAALLGRAAQGGSRQTRADLAVGLRELGRVLLEPRERVSLHGAEVLPAAGLRRLRAVGQARRDRGATLGSPALRERSSTDGWWS
ncbi:hypothetical protein OV079_23625 [Nannocystis pusilla]|uniref:Uncharacterized protein n=1 Tax=Nannocystis pusilla TaxID=889268 RepID=A0A9X3EZG1_9BACT|nr:hypothetical protein [Nannocystis pusilla]MCY1008493.1 hypothetical protein [Nannocystis pusilla]